MAGRQEILNAFLSSSVADGYEDLVNQAISIGASAHSSGAISVAIRSGHFSLLPILIKNHLEDINAFPLKDAVKYLSKHTENEFNDNLKKLIDRVIHDYSTQQKVSRNRSMLMSLSGCIGNMESDGAIEFCHYFIEQLMTAKTNLDKTDMFLAIASSIDRNFAYRYASKVTFSNLLADFFLSLPPVEGKTLSDFRLHVRNLIPLWLSSGNNGAIKKAVSIAGSDDLFSSHKSFLSVSTNTVLNTCRKYNLKNLDYNPFLDLREDEAKKFDYEDVRCMWEVLANHVETRPDNYINSVCNAITISCNNDLMSSSEIITYLDQILFREEILPHSIVLTLLSVNEKPMTISCMYKIDSCLAIIDIAKHLINRQISEVSTSDRQEFKPKARLLAFMLCSTTGDSIDNKLGQHISQLSAEIKNKEFTATVVSEVESLATSLLIEALKDDSKGITHLPMQNISTYHLFIDSEIWDKISERGTSSRTISSIPSKIYDSGNITESLAALIHLRVNPHSEYIQGLAKCRSDRFIEHGLRWLGLTPLEALSSYGDMATPSHKEKLLNLISR